MRTTLPVIAVVTRQTRLEGLTRRRATRGAAKFVLASAHGREREVRRKLGGEASADLALMDALEAAGGFDEYEDEDQAYSEALERLKRELDFGYPISLIDRDFLPNFDFGRCVVVVVVGQDGLVANAAKYVGDLPIVGVNPDPKRNDGILLSFTVDQARSAVKRTLDRRTKTRSVTLAEVRLNDGQRLLAFNDFFIGAASHVSARYTLQAGVQVESQSSSGLLISTGAGSTGWMSSVFNMTRGMVTVWTGKETPPQVRLPWDDRRLIWAVREPFKSKHSQCGLVSGLLQEHEELVIESLMPSDGVIFSDGVESDFLEFNSGTIARVSVSPQSSHLVVE